MRLLGEMGLDVDVYAAGRLNAVHAAIRVGEDDIVE